MPDLSQYKEWLLLRDRSPTTIHNYCSVIQQYYSKYHGDIVEFKRHLRSFSDGYRNFCINAIKSYYRFSGQEIDSEVFSLIRVRDSHRTLIPVDTVQDTVDCLRPHHRATKDVVSWRNYCIVGMFAYTGIRPTQLCNILVSDISPDGSVYIGGIKREAAHRVWPIPKLYRAIMRYVSLSGLRPELTGFNPKDFRTTFAIEYLKRLRELGISDIRKVQKALGHNSILSTEIYLDLLDELEQKSSEVGLYEY